MTRDQVLIHGQNPQLISIGIAPLPADSIHPLDINVFDARYQVERSHPQSQDVKSPLT